MIEYKAEKLTSSVTRQPFSERTDFSSRFFNSSPSFSSWSSAMVFRARRAKRMSSSMPSILVLITGTKASSTGRTYSTWGIFRRKVEKVAKKSDRSMCRGQTISVSMSAPGGMKNGI